MVRPCYLVLTAMAIALAPAAASPQTSPAQGGSKPAARESAVNACVKQVRTAIPASRFDAYVSTRGPVQMSGNAREQALFTECLRERGHGIELEERPRG